MFIDSRPQQTGKPRRGDMSSQDGTRGLYMSPLRGLPDISIAVFYRHTTPNGVTDISRQKSSTKSKGIRPQWAGRVLQRAGSRVLLTNFR